MSYRTYMVVDDKRVYLDEHETYAAYTCDVCGEYASREQLHEMTVKFSPNDHFTYRKEYLVHGRCLGKIYEQELDSH